VYTIWFAAQRGKDGGVMRAFALPFLWESGSACEAGARWR